MKYLLMILFVVPAFAQDVQLDSTGSGLESLMAGIGQARIGSNGALTSNPALLSWLPEKREFISTNTIQYFKFGNSKHDLSPEVEVVPVYAATTEGYGNWGFGYGLVVDSTRGSFRQVEDEIVTSGSFENTGIGFQAGAGYKVKPDLSLGLTLELLRFSQKSQIGFTGTIAGNDFIGFGTTESQSWALSTNLGVAKTFDSWALAASANFNLLKFGAVAKQKVTQYFESTGEHLIEKDHDISPTNVNGVYSAGVQKKYMDFTAYGDVYYMPAQEDEEGARTPGHFSYGIGLEKVLSETWNLYSGLGYVPKLDIDNGKDPKDSGTVSAGASRKGKHSLSYAGIQWAREIINPKNEVIRFLFGTQFEY